MAKTAAERGKNFRQKNPEKVKAYAHDARQREKEYMETKKREKRERLAKIAQEARKSTHELRMLPC